MSAEYCKKNNCPWLDTFKEICKSPNDVFGGKCDFDRASRCPKCHKLVAVGYDDDGCCPYCGTDLSEKKECNFLEEREWIEGYENRWYRKKFYCPSCGTKIRTESWNEKRCFGVGTILSDNTMPKFCPNCGTKIGEAANAEMGKN